VKTTRPGVTRLSLFQIRTHIGCASISLHALVFTNDFAGLSLCPNLEQSQSEQVPSRALKRGRQPRQGRQGQQGRV
jgi:hypothetical protein